MTLFFYSPLRFSADTSTVTRYTDPQLFFLSQFTLHYIFLASVFVSPPSSILL
jgi:hypothetical protein